MLDQSYQPQGEQGAGQGFGQLGGGQQGFAHTGRGQQGLGHGSQQGLLSQQQLVRTNAVAHMATSAFMSFILHSSN